MNNRDDRYSLFTVIVNRGKASAILKDAKSFGVTGGTIVYGFGTARDELLHFLELYEVEKEILFMIVKNEMVKQLFEEIEKKYKLFKPHRGIAFSSPLSALAGKVGFEPNNKMIENRGNEMDYEAIFVVVEKHKGEIVVEVAEKYGSKGATIIHARGSGVHEKGTIFNLVIEPEKEIVLLIVPSEDTNKIIDGIKEELQIDKPGEGIIFAIGVNETAGLVK